MNHREIDPKYKSVECISKESCDNHFCVKVRLDENVIEYKLFKDHMPKCECSSSNDIQFYYLKSNNSVTPFCIHCNTRGRAMKKHENEGKRDNSKYSYFFDYQREIDRFFCEICLSSDGLQTHHIEEVQNAGSHDPENLQLLCCHCHDIVHSIRKIKNV